jgi:hypothetical protein
MKTIVVTNSIHITDNDYSYHEKALKLISGYLEFTDFDILVLTNNVDYFKHINNKRLLVFNYDENFNEPIKSANKFNMHLKRYPLRLATKMNYDVIYHHDCDCYINGWDSESYDKLINQDYDVIFPSSPRPQLGGLRKTHKHFQQKIDREFVGLYYDELDQSPNPAETRIIFKNNDKLKVFLDFWDKISNNNNNYLTYYCGVYFGTSSIHSKMKMGQVVRNLKFSSYGKISHQNKTLNYFGEYINE